MNTTHPFLLWSPGAAPVRPPVDPALVSARDYLKAFEDYLNTSAETKTAAQRDELRAVIAACVKLRSKICDLARRQCGQDVIAMTSGEARNPGPQKRQVVANLERGALASSSRSLALPSRVLGQALRGAGAYAAREGQAAIARAVRDYFNGPAPSARTSAPAPAATPRSTAARTSAPSTSRPRPARTAAPRAAQPLTSVKNRAKNPRSAAGVTSAVQGAIVRTSTTKVRIPAAAEKSSKAVSVEVPIYDIVKTAAADDQFVNYGFDNGAKIGVRVQPGLQLGSQLRQIAGNYAEYRITRLRLEYVPEVGNNANGSVYIVYDPTGVIEPPEEDKEISETCAFLQCQPGVPAVLELPQRMYGGWKRVRTTEYIQGTRSDYDAGVIWAMSQWTTGFVPTQLLGRVRAHVSVEFRCLQTQLPPMTLSAPIEVYSLSPASPTANPQTLVLAKLSPAALFTKPSVIPNFLEFEPGVYRITWHVLFACATSASPIRIFMDGSCLVDKLYTNKASHGGALLLSQLHVSGSGTGVVVANRSEQASTLGWLLSSGGAFTGLATQVLDAGLSMAYMTIERVDD